MADSSARANVKPAIQDAVAPRSGASLSHAADTTVAPSDQADRANPERDLAGALHEVSNALTVVLGWIERARGGSAEEVESALDIAATRARQAHHIVRRAIGAEVSVDCPCTVAEVVRDAVMGLEPEARRLEVQIEPVIAPDVVGATLGKGSTVLQVLTNLLLNALSVSPPCAVVRVDARSAGGSVVLGVADDGPGISPERRATLFESGISTRIGGAGIGLRHAAALARTAGGALSLASSERGARFELRWPCFTEKDGARTHSVVRTQAALEGARILLVEDDEAVVELLDTALTARGAIVVSARSSEALRGALVTGMFDAALLDISPIREDIAGALNAVRVASPAVKVIVISGSASNLSAVPERGDALWVRKPFEIREIVEALVR